MTCTLQTDNIEPFRYQSTPQDPPTAFQIETSQKNIEDYLNRWLAALQADLQCLRDEIDALDVRVTALEP